MKHLKSFNESNSNDINSLIDNLSSKIDYDSLKLILKPFSKTLNRMASKYSTNGKIDVRLVEKDFSINEGFGDDLLNMVVGLIKLPIRIFQMIVNKIFGINDLTTSLMVAVVVIVLGFGVYQIGEHAINGMTIGVIKEVEFVPEHEESVRHTYTDSDGKEQEYYTYETIPDTWNARVKGASNDRVEIWTTTDRSIGAEADNGEVVRIENWSWSVTIDRGHEMGGGLSGGGAGGKY